jgi:hypothetical protein
MNEKPSIELNEWLKSDLIVELWETRPKLVEKRNEETLETVKEVLLENGVPAIEKRLRGVIFLFHLIYFIDYEIVLE